MTTYGIYHNDGEHIWELVVGNSCWAFVELKDLLKKMQELGCFRTEHLNG